MPIRDMDMYGGALNMHVHPPSPTTQASTRRLSAEGLAVAPLIPLKYDAQVLHMHRHKAVYMQS